MFTRTAKPTRLIGDPDNQRPIKWRFTVLWQVNMFLLVGLKYIHLQIIFATHTGFYTMKSE